MHYNYLDRVIDNIIMRARSVIARIVQASVHEKLMKNGGRRLFKLIDQINVIKIHCRSTSIKFEQPNLAKTPRAGRSPVDDVDVSQAIVGSSGHGGGSSDLD